MKKAILYAVAAALGAIAALAELALVAPPASVNGTVTNSVAAPAGMQGWAEVDIVAGTLPTNAPAVYSLYTARGEGTNAALAALSQYAPPLTNAAPVAALRFPSASVGTNLVLVAEFPVGATNVFGAILRYISTYPR